MIFHVGIASCFPELFVSLGERVEACIDTVHVFDHVLIYQAIVVGLSLPVTVVLDHRLTLSCLQQHVLVRLDTECSIHRFEEGLHQVAEESNIGNGEQLKSLLTQFRSSFQQDFVTKGMERFAYEVSEPGEEVLTLDPFVLRFADACSETDVCARFNRQLVTGFDFYILTVDLDIAIGGNDADAGKGIEVDLS